MRWPRPSEPVTSRRGPASDRVGRAPRDRAHDPAPQDALHALVGEIARAQFVAVDQQHARSSRHSREHAGRPQPSPGQPLEDRVEQEVSIPRHDLDACAARSESGERFDDAARSALSRLGGSHPDVEQVAEDHQSRHARESARPGEQGFESRLVVGMQVQIREHETPLRELERFLRHLPERRCHDRATSPRAPCARSRGARRTASDDRR